MIFLSNTMLFKMLHNNKNQENMAGNGEEKLILHQKIVKVNLIETIAMKSGIWYLYLETGIYLVKSGTSQADRQTWWIFCDCPHKHYSH